MNALLLDILKKTSDSSQEIIGCLKNSELNYKLEIKFDFQIE